MGRPDSDFDNDSQKDSSILEKLLSILVLVGLVILMVYVATSFTEIQREIGS